VEKYADLHIHTNFSDSTLTPEEVIKDASREGLSCISIVDHDTVDGFEPTRKAGEASGIEVLSGVELSCEVNGKDVHIIGYLIDCNNEKLREQFVCMQDTRVGRMKRMIEKLRELGIENIDLQEVRDLAMSQSVGRPHLAMIMKKTGAVSSIKEAFDKYISDEGPAYVKKFKQTPQEGIELIRQAGGVAILAHPMVTNVDELIPSFVEAGLDGLEAHYPNNSKKIVNFYANLAKKHDILVTGGSDSHGKSKTNTYIGKIKLPYEHVERMKERASSR